MDNSAILDHTAATVTVDDEGLVRVSGAVMFRRVVRDGELWLQFYDRDRMRSQARGSRLIEVEFDALMARLIKDVERREK